MGRLRGVVRDAARRGRLPLHARHPHRPAARGVRLEPGDRRPRRQHQPAAVRLHRAVRGGPAGPLRAAPGDHRRPGRHLPRCAGTTRDDRAVAAVPAVGRRRRRRLGLHGDRLRLDRGEPLVRRPPRPRHRRADGGDGERPARLPAAALAAGRGRRLALGRRHDRHRRAGRRPGRGRVPARPPRGRRAAALRRRPRRRRRRAGGRDIRPGRAPASARSATLAQRHVLAAVRQLLRVRPVDQRPRSRPTSSPPPTTTASRRRPPPATSP